MGTTYFLFFVLFGIFPLFNLFSFSLAKYLWIGYLDGWYVVILAQKDIGEIDGLGI
jgi:hypothetical protein